MIKLFLALGLAYLSGWTGSQEALSSAQEAPTGVLREEFFVLEALPWDLDPSEQHDLQRPHAEARVMGLAACRRRNDEDGRMLEWDLRFAAGDVRVLHVERESDVGPSLVWREWQADRGRTVTVEPRVGSAGGASGAAHILEWGGERPVRRDLDPRATLPLGLLEDLRAGVIEEGAFAVFDPLSRRLDELRVHTARPTPTRRIVQLRRPDRSIAGTYIFEGADLAGFQWQAGHLRARRIDATDYLQRLADQAR